MVNRRHNTAFSVFAKDWFIWDKCSYLERKRSRGEYSRNYAEKQLGYLLNHILPYFKDQKLSHLNVEEIEKWLIALKKEMSPVTANRALSVLKVMLKEAHYLGYIPKDPSKLVTKLQEKIGEKGIFSLKEARSILNPRAYDVVWNGDLLHYCINMLAAITGMRLGEIQALKLKYLHEDYIEIRHSWDRKYGIKVPKANSFRAVSIPSFAYEFLNQLVHDRRIVDTDALVFAGKDPYKAIDHKAVLKHYYRALHSVGVSENFRRERNLTLHSWRHFFNTFMRGRISDTQLRRLTDHRTETMTDHYDHQFIEELESIKLVQETMLLEQ